MEQPRQLDGLLPSGEAVTAAKAVPAHGRLTIDIEGEGDPGLRDTAVSTVVTSDRPIIAERSMYWDALGVFWSGGANATGMRLP